MSGALIHLRTRMIGVPLLIQASKAETIFGALGDRLYGMVQADALPGPVAAYRRPARSIAIDKATGIAILPVVGTTVHRGEAIEALSGVVSYTALQADIGSLINNPNVRGIILDVASGGGEASGIHELADFIKFASGEKPIWAIANTVSASAAYWLASATEKLIAAPGSSVGSIGVYVAHADHSEQLAKRGVVISFVFAGQHKVDGNPYGPLSEDVREEMQAGVNSLYQDFVGAVASNRGLDPSKVRATEARMYGPDAALEIGLVDYVGTLGAVQRFMAEDMGATTQHVVAAIGGRR